jgi:hypothetical protein
MPETSTPLPAFGFYWEVVHERSGDVIGDGLGRAEPPRLPDRPGCATRVITRHAGVPPSDPERSPA